MNKTKRKIFETSMKLFAQKGYDATSVEEITSVVGIAKGTLYYHFPSKEDIFNFLIDEGMKLLKNSIEIKTAKFNSAVSKIKAVILIQIKITAKYEDFITLIISQMYGTGSRNQKCKECVTEYLHILEKIIKKGIADGEIKQNDAKILSSVIFGLTSSSLIYKIRTNEALDVATIYQNFSDFIVKILK